MVRITVLGDIMISQEQLVDYKKDGLFDFYPALKSIEKFANSDYIVANLETPIAGEQFGYTDQPYCFNSPIELAETLKKVGVDMVETCNNHCMDRGVDGLDNTITNLDKVGLKHIGTRKTPGNSYEIVELKGLKIGFLAFTYGTNAFLNHNYLKKQEKYKIDLLQPQEVSNTLERWIVTSNMVLVRYMRALFSRIHMFQFQKPIYERTQYARREIKHLKECIYSCKESGADYIIAMIHVGGQYNKKPTDYTKKICKLCRDYGVNAVMANHEHVIHPIERDALSHHSICEYSLGNFLSASGVQEEPYDRLSEYSAVYHIDIDEKRKNMEATYSVELFINHLVDGYGVVTQPVAEYMEQITGEQKDKVQRDYQILMNRIMGTEHIDYTYKKEHKIEVLS